MARPRNGWVYVVLQAFLILLIGLGKKTMIIEIMRVEITLKNYSQLRMRIATQNQEVIIMHII